MVQQTTATSPRDILAHDGSAIRRGYLEIILEAQEPNTDDSAIATPVTVGLLDQHSRLERMIDHRTFPSRIPIALDRTQRRKIAVALMDRLTNTLQVSAFTDDLEDYDAQLDRFGKYLEEASAEAVLANANHAATA